MWGLLDMTSFDLRTNGIIGSILISKDGNVLASQLPDNVDVELIGIRFSSIFGALGNTLSDLGKNVPKQIVIENHGEKILMTDMGEEILIVIMESEGKADIDYNKRIMEEIKVT